jgi:hypothetical protein
MPSCSLTPQSLPLSLLGARSGGSQPILELAMPELQAAARHAHQSGAQTPIEESGRALRE